MEIFFFIDFKWIVTNFDFDKNNGLKSLIFAFCSLSRTSELSIIISFRPQKSIIDDFLSFFLVSRCSPKLTKRPYFHKKIFSKFIMFQFVDQGLIRLIFLK